MDKEYTNISDLIFDRVFVYDYVIFDASSLFDQRLDKFLFYLASAKKKYPSRYNQRRTECIVCGDTLNFLQGKSTDPRAKNALRYLKANEKHGLLTFYEDSSKQIVDQIARGNRSLLYVTESFKPYEFFIKTVYGEHVPPERFNYLKIHNFMANTIIPILVRMTEKEKEQEKKAKKPEPIKVPTTGGVVYSLNGQPMKLGKEIGDGGEAHCYCFDSSDEYICKIFDPQSVDLSKKKEKVEYLVSLAEQLNDSSLAWPLGCVYDRQNRFIGYYMERIQGAIPLERLTCSLKERKDILHNKANLMKICINLCKIFVKLHENYILVGDISFLNILFNPSTYDVYLIDIDSVQADQFFCPLNTAEFVAPEYIDDNLRRMNVTFREEQGELFLLAKALFEIIMCEPLYAFNLGEFYRGYKNGDFAFPFQQKSEGGDYSRLQTEGRYRPQAFVWDNLPIFIRAEFYNIFNGRNGKYFLPGRRTTAFQWFKRFSSYLKYLASQPTNSPDLEVNPTSFSQYSGPQKPARPATEKSSSESWYDDYTEASRSKARKAESQPAFTPRPNPAPKPKPNKPQQKPNNPQPKQKARPAETISYEFNESPKAIASLRNLLGHLMNNLSDLDECDDIPEKKKKEIHRIRTDFRTAAASNHTLLTIFKAYCDARVEIIWKVLRLKKAKDLEYYDDKDYLQPVDSSIDDELEEITDFFYQRTGEAYEDTIEDAICSFADLEYKDFPTYYTRLYQTFGSLVYDLKGH